MPVLRRVSMYLGSIFVWALCASPVFATTTAPVQTNDTFVGRQWYLDAIHAREGWNVATGSRDVVVAVIDSGVDIDHPDLKNNVWVNPNETAKNGKDDDGDGFTDDVNGWNFVSNSADVRPVRAVNAVREAWIHGTAVASLIAAAGNDDVGISGVAWRARIMPLVVLGPDGYGRDEHIIHAIRYAVAHGADIINLSLVGYEFNEDLATAIHEATAQGVLVVSAAGNSDTEPHGENLDDLPGYPACDKGAAGRGALTVTALTRLNQKAPLANYGTCVDVSAPGYDLYAARPMTEPGNAGEIIGGYVDGLDGTSVAAPLVTGLAVLLKAQHPSWQGPDIAARIIATTDSVNRDNPTYTGKMGSGRINVARALEQDEVTRRLGPLSLEVTDVGYAPEVRIRAEDGTVLSRFFVSDQGDTRGIRATFARWQGKAEPDIIVTMIDDHRGAWRVYRPDGLLIAAGEQGIDIRNGLNVAAQDLASDGRDELFFGERGGSRSWLVSSVDGSSVPLTLFTTGTHRGINALSVTRPTPSFLVTSAYGDRDIRIVGKGGGTLVEARATSVSTSGAWIGRSGARKGGGMAYELMAPGGNVVLVNDANGLSVTKESIRIDRWVQIPEGQPTETGWRVVETWPR